MTARYVRVTDKLAVVFVLSVTLSANAQDRTPAVEKPFPNVEIGAAASGLPGWAYGPGVRVSVARKQPFAFELGVDWTDLGRDERYVDQMMWFYFWQVKQVLAAPASGPRFFVTYGTAGWAERTSERFGADTRFKAAFIPPLFPLLGFGGQHVLAKYAAVRVEAQLIVLWGEVPVTGRLSGGVSIPIGAYRR